MNNMETLYIADSKMAMGSNQGNEVHNGHEVYFLIVYCLYRSNYVLNF